MLFVTVPTKDKVTIKPHPDEVDDICWVSQSQLLEMFANKDLLFSPWFRLIANRWMIGGDDNNGKEGWWDDLDRTMTTDYFCVTSVSIASTLLGNIWEELGMLGHCLMVDNYLEREMIENVNDADM